MGENLPLPTGAQINFVYKDGRKEVVTFHAPDMFMEFRFGPLLAPEHDQSGGDDARRLLVPWLSIWCKTSQNHYAFPLLLASRRVSDLMARLDESQQRRPGSARIEEDPTYNLTQSLLTVSSIQQRMCAQTREKTMVEIRWRWPRSLLKDELERGNDDFVGALKMLSTRPMEDLHIVLLLKYRAEMSAAKAAAELTGARPYRGCISSNKSGSLPMRSPASFFNRDTALRPPKRARFETNNSVKENRHVPSRTPDHSWNVANTSFNSTPDETSVAEMNLRARSAILDGRRAPLRVGGLYSSSGARAGNSAGRAKLDYQGSGLSQPNKPLGFRGNGFLRTSTQSSENGIHTAQRGSDWWAARSSEASRPVVRYEGLQNLGNTCYMNAVLQALMSLTPLVADIMSTLLMSRLVLESTAQAPFFRALVEVIQKAQMERHGVIDPRGVKRTISGLNATFIGFNQQDAHEFFVSSLDHIEHDVDPVVRDISALGRSRENGVSVVGEVEATGDLDREPSLQIQRARYDVCPVARNFQSVMENRLTCAKCRATVTIFEPYVDLCLDIDHDGGNEQNIQQLFDAFFRDEEVDHSCEACGNDKATISRALAAAPRVLCLQVKRFVQTVTRHEDEGEVLLDVSLYKDNSPVRPSKVLNLAERTITSSPIGPLAWPQPLRDFSDSHTISTNASVADQGRKSKSPEVGSQSTVDLTTKPLSLDLSEDDSQLREAIELSRKEAEELSEDTELKRALEESRQYAGVLESDSDDIPAVPRGNSDKSVKFEFRDFFEDPKHHGGGVRVDILTNSRYRLVSAVLHIGSTATAGHYVTEVWSAPQKKWHRFDDSVVREHDESDALGPQTAKQCYLLFYVHESIMQQMEEGATGQEQ